MRERRGQCGMVLALIALNLVVFLLQLIMPAWAQEPFIETFGLSVNGLLAGRWWQFLTYAFLHGNAVHFLLNMIGLWFAGRLVEPLIGPWRLLLLYLFCAVAAGLLQMALAGQYVLIGASGSVFGIIVAFTAMLPDVELFVLVFFILPLRMRAKVFGWAVFLFALLGQIGAFYGIFPWIGHAAHLGGCIGGYIFARLSGFAHPSGLESTVIRPFGRR